MPTIAGLKARGKETAYFDMQPTKMMGGEEYPIVGDLVSKRTAATVIKAFGLAGLLLTAGCHEKATIAIRLLDNKFASRPVIVGGSIRVASGDRSSYYGHDWNPPGECHIWIECDGGIIDFALPGVILRGLTTRDAVGPFLVGRKPAILAGPSPEWVIYERKQILMARSFARR